jgi:hypothetical protein
MREIWRFVNRPVVIVLLALALWPVVSAWQRRLTVRATLRTIVEEAQGDQRPGGKPLKELGAAITSQLTEGFASTFDKMNKDKMAKLAAFNSALPQVTVSEVKAGTARFPHREKIIGSVRNGSSSAISDLRLNFMMYAQDGSLIDVDDKTLHEIKLLQPGQLVGFSVDRDLGDPKEDKAVLDSRRSAKINAQVVSFEIPQWDAKKPE